MTDNKTDVREDTVQKAAVDPQKPMGGYHGKILRVDLTGHILTDEATTYEFVRKYMGGAGFVAYYLWNELKGGEDPLGPENKLIIALGPLSGLTFAGAARFCVGAKSPLTGGIAKSEAGGYWMADMKRAGYDAIIVEGRSEAPVYLWIDDGKAEIRDASRLWGKDVKETQESIQAELHDNQVKVMSIGPAGENMVRYACISRPC